MELLEDRDGQAWIGGYSSAIALRQAVRDHRTFLRPHRRYEEGIAAYRKAVALDPEL